MKMTKEVLRLMYNRIIKRLTFGESLKIFCDNMGVAYIKLAQILATQNYKGILKDKDRKALLEICDNVKTVPFKEIEAILKDEFGDELYNIFECIDCEPLGSASVSQVHRAVLKDTKEEVAIKVKRKDVVKSIESDIKVIRILYNTVGKILKFTNKSGGNHALDLYLKWIMEETDFINEAHNMKLYQKFASDINGVVEGAHNIVIPKVYDDLCRDNVIVMEYIKTKTLKNLDSKDPLVQEKISEAISSYLKSNFYAVIHDKDVIFHGDPHGGNIYVDENGNVGFLDMGLVFALNKEDRALLRDFAFNAFSQDYEKLYDTLIVYGNMSKRKAEKFKNEIKNFCETISTKDISFYFTDMIEICLKYELLPPNFLFCMSKAFLCLNGIADSFSVVNTAKEIVLEQLVEYSLKNSFTDISHFALKGFKVFPHFLHMACEKGLTFSFAHSTNELIDLYGEFKKIVSEYEELINLIDKNSNQKTNEQKKKEL